MLLIAVNLLVLLLGSAALSTFFEWASAPGEEERTFSLPFADMLLVTAAGMLLFLRYSWAGTSGVLGAYAAYCLIGGLLERGRRPPPEAPGSPARRAMVQGRARAEAHRVKTGFYPIGMADGLPDILPLDVARWTPERIARRLTQYTGLTNEELEHRMQPGQLSLAGFLAPGERLAEVIHRDALTLERLGLSRHELADRLLVIYRFKDGTTRHGDLEGETVFYMGHQQDPFYEEDIYGVIGMGAASFTLTNVKLADRPTLAGGDLSIALIRSACFFQGRVPHRLEPELCARVLGFPT